MPKLNLETTIDFLKATGLKWYRKLCRNDDASYLKRLHQGSTSRPSYGYCVYCGAKLAKSLGHRRISVIEFGVAGGIGLLALENYAKTVSRMLRIDIDVYGFDTGEGLPAPIDYRDLPYHWKQGFFGMDRSKLEAKLDSATVIYGNVSTTLQSFVANYNPAPVAAVIHDMDYYSSTSAALGMFDLGPKVLLPRIFCYFDDIVGSETELYNDYTGQRLAISEFNSSHNKKKIAKNYHLTARYVVKPWHHQIFIYHDFEHPDYTTFISRENQQLPLRAK